MYTMRLEGCWRDVKPTWQLPYLFKDYKKCYNACDLNYWISQCKPFKIENPKLENYYLMWNYE